MNDTRTKLSYVQVSRAVAILFVLLGHANTQIYQAYGYDWFNMGVWERTGGVDFFFIVTGFMIYYLYHKQIGLPGKAKEFLIKRVVRIFPLYWIFTFLMVLAAFLINDFEPHYSWKVIVKSFLFVESNPVIGSTWSLKHILFFYMIFGASIYKPKRMKPILVVWVILTILTEVRLLSILDSFIFSFSSLEVLMGSLVAYWILNHKVRYSTVWIVSGILGFLSIWLNNIFLLYEIHAPFFFCLFSMLIMLGIAEKDKKPRKVPKLLSFLGDASYSIYIAHGPFLSIFIILLGMVSPVYMVNGHLLILLVSLLTTVSCCFVYIFVEKPITAALRRKVLHKGKDSFVVTSISTDIQVVKNI
jgi:exopolysaccharide production protein ExoZ